MELRAAAVADAADVLEKQTNRSVIGSEERLTGTERHDVMRPFALDYINCNYYNKEGGLERTDWGRVKNSRQWEKETGEREG